MEVVTRMTYSELFQFKKCLLETGQLVLAKTVPVKTVPPFAENLEDESLVAKGKSFADYIYEHTIVGSCI